MGDLLDLFFAGIVLLGFWCGIFFIYWIISKICQFFEVLKYKAKLKKITPQIESINTEELFAKLTLTKESYLKLMGQIQQQYGTAEEPWENARTYKEKETVHKTIIEDWYSVKFR
jgi:hypothetical protein